MYYYNNNKDDNSTNSENIHNGPLFSQPFDPTALNGGGMPINYNDHTQHTYDPLNDPPLFDNSYFNDNWSTQQQQQDISTSLQQQEAILLSDPNFLRQHQLLQDQQQKEMHTRLIHDENSAVQDPVLVSNLTAMFEPQHSIKPEPMTAAEVEEEDKKLKKNRRQQVVMKNSENENDNDAKIDHQRRFNELQARFRVNYARKPTQQQQQTSASPVVKSTAANSSSTKPAKQQLLPQQPPPLHSSPLQKPLSIPKQQPQTQSQPQPIVQNNNNRHNNNNNTNTNSSLSSTPPVMIGGLVMTNNINNNTNEEILNINPEASLSSSFPSRTMPIQIQRVARQCGSQAFDAESHQKQLDSQLEKVDFNDITVSELKEMLRQRGKPATGKKAVLLQRLQEERDVAKNGGRRLNRHSQPLPFSRSIDSTSQQQQQSSRPRSFQGGLSSSPVMIQNSYHNNQHDNLLLLSGSPSSPQASTSFIPGSPSASLHRSIANMHIGSPPPNNNSRRYSPYSPRLSSSPKPIHHAYSSSVPLSSGDNLSSSPILMNNALSVNSNNNNNGNMMLSSSYSIAASKPSCRYYNNPKTYKPFMSSTLATPDREEDVNPFDSYYNGGDDPPIKEEEIPAMEEPSQYMDMNNNMNMDWLDPSQFEILLQQQGKIF